MKESKATRVGSGNKGSREERGMEERRGRWAVGEKRGRWGRREREREPAKSQSMKEMKSPHQAASQSLERSRKLLAEGVTDRLDLKDLCKEMMGP